jgi:hypothetical protein
MADMIAGPGQGLPPPQALYPPTITGTTPYTAPTNRFQLNAGAGLLVPAGTWIVEGGDITRLQWKDPVNRQWNNLVRSPAIPDPTRHWGATVRSDGFNFRVHNISGVALGAEVTNGGSGYVPHTTHVVPSAGNSRWRPIIGGQLGAVDIIEAGANYSLAPIVFVPAPPYPGICASGVANITNGALSGITWINPGAGYPFPPEVLLLTDPFDPVQFDAGDGFGSRLGDMIMPAKVRVHLTGNGSLTGVLLENFGEFLNVAPTLTVSGQGTGATADVVPLVANWVAPLNDEVTIQPSSGP